MEEFIMEEVFKLIEYLTRNPRLVAAIGDCPNVEKVTGGGKVFWEDTYVITGWRLQVNRLTHFARILDGNNIR